MLMRKLFFSFLLALVVPMVAGAQEKEMYAVYDEDAKTFTFYYDNDRASHSGEVYDLTPADQYGNGSPQWVYAYWKNNVTKAVFDASFADARPTTTHAWFYEFGHLEKIEGIEYLNTSEVTDMKSMFGSCSSLTALDVSHFDTSNVTNMVYMFGSCSSLTALDVSHFNTSNVTDMNFMFFGCKSLTDLDVSHFDTGKVTDMNNMFYNCNAVTSLDVSHFDTSNVTNMGSMFAGCHSTALDVSHFDTSKVTYMTQMFSDCAALSLDVSHFVTSKVTDMRYMFMNCYALTTLDVSHFDVSNVKDMGYMFCGCNNLSTIYCNDDWNAEGLSSGYMFGICTSLVGGIGTVFDKTKADVKMAHPDTKDNPGYFTRKADSQEWAEGDLNHDGKVDAADVVWLTNLIMNQK